ncbi:hypothetical protein FHS72_003659 [Loktanella ponticola]|uniref:Probable membrane transporter protein n=1 Tax=Yoonia ponticola TaxID=1524255 RepID=A0A7W9BP03_9RHOB|nr:sulfite exporter TauE/SafE family protein [Yoonia ponticola]MBB5724011.1 hypothetical protein [Yoonia ponticola]
MFTPTVCFVLLAVLFSAVIRGLAGFGFSIAAVPLVSLILPPVDAVTLAILLQLILGTYELYALKGQSDKGSLTRLTIGAVFGTPLGIYAITALSPDGARIAISIAVLLGLAILLRNKTTALRPNNGLEIATGLASGIFSGLAAMPGPPAVAYYLGIGMPPKQTRASLMVFFFFVSVIATPGLALAGAINAQMLLLVLVCVPVFFLGTWIGARCFARLGDTQYRSIAITVMAISGVLAGWRGLSVYL